MTVTILPRIAIAASMLAGCSLLYNPNNLPSPPDPVIPDGPPVDAREPDAPPIDVTALKLGGALPAMLLEGQGDGGSRPAVVVVTGENIGPDATVTLVAPRGVTPAPMVQVDNAHAARAPNGHVLAVPVTLAVDTGRATGTMALTVQVSQMTPTGPIAAMASNPVTVQYLPELTAAITDPAALAAKYSEVKLSGTVLSFPASASASRVAIVAVASIDLGGVHADAMGSVPGSGGGAGGPAKVVGGGPSGGQPGNFLVGNQGAVVAGGGGGYRVAGGGGHDLGGNIAAPGGGPIGDDFVSSYATNRSSGGGGGGMSAGGGGGGTIEITAGGTLKIGPVSAGGAAGGGDGLLSGAAGGGTGGTVVLRSKAGSATLGAVTVSAGAAGHNGALTPAAGAGSDGRVRYEAVSVTGAPAAPARRGAVFAHDNPVATSDPQPAISLISAAGSDAFKLFVVDGAGATTTSMTVVFGSPTALVRPPLSPGYNQVCVTTPQGGPTIEESKNCIEIGYAR
jgi:hypothetical protein